MFRQTLVVHADRRLKRDLNATNVVEFQVASSARPEDPAAGEKIWSNETQSFKLPSGATLSSGAPITKYAITKLASLWPNSVAFRDLVKQARSECPDDSALAGVDDATLTQRLGADLLRCYSRGIVEFHVTPDLYACEPAEKPNASELARLQAKTLKKVTNLRHETLNIDN
jgi:methyltransferase-like protein